MTLFAATLHELALCSPEPLAAAAFYERALGMSFVDDGDGLHGSAPGRRLRLVPGAKGALHYAAYAVADAAQVDALRARLVAAGVTVGEAPIPGFAVPPLRFADPDGNMFLVGIAAASGATGGSVVAQRPARLQHVVFASTDAARLLAFYIDVVGFTLSDRVVDGAGDLRTAFVRCSHEHHSLAVFQTDCSRLDHHCLETGDWGLIRDWADHLAAEHIPLKWGPGRHGPGNNLFMFFHDPDGNWVELSAELEIVAADRPVGEWPHEERTLNSWGMGLLRS